MLVLYCQCSAGSQPGLPVLLLSSTVLLPYAHGHIGVEVVHAAGMQVLAQGLPGPRDQQPGYHEYCTAVRILENVIGNILRSRRAAGGPDDRHDAACYPGATPRSMAHVVCWTQRKEIGGSLIASTLWCRRGALMTGPFPRPASHPCTQR
jgi:hypothetical protein